MPGQVDIGYGTGRAMPGDAMAWRTVDANVTHAQSSTTLTDVTGLYVPIFTSTTSVWFFEAFLTVTAAGGTSDIKFGWTVPASATMQWALLSNGSSAFVSWGPTGGLASTPTAIRTQSDTEASPTRSGTVGASLAGFIYGGGTAGNVQLQFAQNTSDASDLTINRGSFIRYRRMLA